MVKHYLSQKFQRRRKQKFYTVDDIRLKTLYAGRSEGSGTCFNLLDSLKSLSHVSRNPIQLPQLLRDQTSENEKINRKTIQQFTESSAACISTMKGITDI